MCQGSNSQDPFKDLTPAQKAKILAQVDEMKNPLSAEKVESYAEVWKVVGQSVAETAKQLGIAANEFLDTKAGMIAVVMIAWHVAGKDFIVLQRQLFRYVLGIFLFFTFVPIWLYLFRRMCIIKEVVYGEDKKKKRIVYHDPGYSDSVQNGTRALMAVVFFCLMGVIALVMFA